MSVTRSVNQLLCALLIVSLFPTSAGAERLPTASPAKPSTCAHLEEDPTAVWNETWRCFENAARGIDERVLIPTDYAAPRAITINPGTSPFAPPTMDAGSDRTTLINETVSLDGSASSGIFDGFQVDGQHSDRWTFGYGNFTFSGGSIVPAAYPTTGVFTVTHTGCNASAECASDTATVTVNAITEGTETIIGDSGNQITNGTNLCNALTTVASQNNPVITITAGVTYDFDGAPCVLPNRTGSGYTTIRSSAFASLPGNLTRVAPANASNMPIITPGDHPANSAINSPSAAFTAPAGTTPAHHYRFVGLHLAKKFPTLDYTNPRGFFDLGDGTPSTVAQLPHHIQIDRCYIDGGNTTSGTARGVALQANDSAVINSYIYRVQGAGVEVQAIWIGMGERIAVINNYLSATSENMLSGGNDVTIFSDTGTAQASGTDSTHIKLAAGASAVTDFYKNKGIYITSGTGACCVGPSPGTYGRIITAYDGTTKIATVDPAFVTIPNGTSVYKIGEHVPTDVVVRRNHFKKDPGWHSTDPSYYGTDMVVKNSFEIKQAKRWVVQGNRMETHWQEDQNWSVVLTVKNQNGSQPWSTISTLDFSYNKIIDVGNCFQILVSDWGAPTLGTDHMLIRHNICSGIGTYDPSGFHNFAVLQDSDVTGSLTTIGEIAFVRNSADNTGTGGTGRSILGETTTKLRNFVYYGNISSGYITHSGTGDGTPALVALTGGGAGSYSFTKNGQYEISGTLPSDNTILTARSDVGFTDIATHNLKLAGGSPLLTTGPNGGRAGADTDEVDVLTLHVVDGDWSSGGGGTSGLGGSKSRGKVSTRGRSNVK
jgi:hypothetical protein